MTRNLSDIDDDACADDGAASSSSSSSSEPMDGISARDAVCGLLGEAMRSSGMDADEVASEEFAATQVLEWSIRKEALAWGGSQSMGSERCKQARDGARKLLSSSRAIREGIRYAAEKMDTSTRSRFVGKRK